MNYKEQIVIGLRGFQAICVALVITGFVWSSADLLLTTVLVGAPVTPLSVLFVFYGLLGAIGNEITIRLVQKKG